MLELLYKSVQTDFFRNISFLVGVFVAVVSIYSARSTAMKKQSSDMIFAARQDDDFRSGIVKLRELYKQGNAHKLAEDENRNTEEAKQITYALNVFEMLAAGIQCGIYHEGILKKNYYTTLTEASKHAAPFIECRRKSNNRPTYYQEFTWLAERWSKRPLKSKKPSWPYNITS